MAALPAKKRPDDEGREHEHAAAIVPIALVEAYKELLDQQDGAVARQRLEAVR